MSNLRIIGLVVGAFGLLLTFMVYRGPKWRRANFILSGLFSISLIAVSINPHIVNSIVGMLALQQEQRRRILALLIFSNIALWFMLLYFKTKLDEHKHQFDLLIRNLGHEEAQSIVASQIKDKQIMVIIPAYNEAKNLGGVLASIPDKIKGKAAGVIVIDDGSKDDTAEVVLKSNCLLVRNRINRGQGA